MNEINQALPHKLEQSQFHPAIPGDPATQVAVKIDLRTSPQFPKQITL